MLDSGVTQKITDVDTTVASTRLYLLFLSLFESKRMPIAFSRPTYEGSGCLHTAPPPPRRRPPNTPKTAIGTLNVWDGSGYGLTQAIRVAECGCLDLMSQKETIRTEACSNNWRGYGVRGAGARPSCAGG